MPYGKRECGSDWCVYNEDTGETVGQHSTEAEADNHLAALYANVPDASRSFAYGGSIVKAAERVIEGFLVKVTGPERRDLYGEYFSPNTDYLRSAFPVIGAPVLFEHARDESVGPIPMGRFTEVQWTPDNDVYVKAPITFAREYDDILKGLEAPDAWVNRQRDYAREYEGMLDEMFSQHILKFSSGALPGGIRVSPSGEILRWPIVEGSMTSHPADAYNNTLVSAREYSQLLHARPPVFQKSVFIHGVTLMPDKTKPERQLDENDLLQLRQMIREEVMGAIGPMMQEEQMEMTPPAQQAVDTAVDQTMQEQKPAEMAEMTPEQPVPEEVIQKAVNKAVTAIFALRDQQLARRQSLTQTARAAAEAAKRAAKPNGGYSRAYTAGQPGADSASRADPTRFGAPHIANPMIKRVEADQKTVPLLSQIKACLPWGHQSFDEDYSRAWRGMVTERYEAQVAEKAQSALIGPLGAWIGEPALREELIDQLRAKTILDKVGMQTTYVDGNQSVERPRLLKSPKAQWVGEGQSVSEDTFRVEMILATPKPLAGLYALPFALMDRMQSSDETTLRNQLTKSLQLAIDDGALNGVGAVPNDASPVSTGAQPLGLLNLLPSAQVVTLGTRLASPDDMTDVKSAVEARDIELTDSAHWVWHPNLGNYFEALTDTTGQLLNPSQWNKGYDPVRSTQIPTNLGTGTNETRFFFGEWSFLEMVMSDQIRLVLLTGDTYTVKLQVGVMAYCYVDFLVHHTEAFEERHGILTS